MDKKFESRNPPSSRILACLAQVVESLDKIADEVDQVGMVVDDVKQNLASGALMNAQREPVLRPQQRCRPDSRQITSALPLFPKSISLSWQVNHAVVAIDERHVVVPFKLGLLVEVLLTSSGAPTGPHDGWKSRSDILILMAKKTGLPVMRHALENLLSRLRKELRRQGGLEAILQCDRRLGVRLALRNYLASPVLPGDVS